LSLDIETTSSELATAVVNISSYVEFHSFASTPTTFCVTWNCTSLKGPPNVGKADGAVVVGDTVGDVGDELGTHVGASVGSREGDKLGRIVEVVGMRVGLMDTVGEEDNDGTLEGTGEVLPEGTKVGIVIGGLLILG